MIDITAWISQFLQTLNKNFGDRVWFVGLQGSYGRGEAKETSDIDIVVILDELSVADIQTYNTMLDSIPNRELLCGFLSGKEDILNWEPSDLFQFYHDTTPIKGDLDELLSLIDNNAVDRAIILETERLILRELTYDDFKPLYAVLGDSDIMKHYPYAFDENKVRNWIERNIGRYRTDGFGLWAVVLKESGEMIGDCGITMQNINSQFLPEIGYHIRKDMQNKGYATEAAAGCIRYGFEKLNFDCLYSYMKYTNSASARVAEKNGMKFIGEYPDDVNYLTRVYCINRKEWKMSTIKNYEERRKMDKIRNDITIRPETTKDYKEIISLILRSFSEGTNYSDGSDIVALIEEIRMSEYYIPELSFVAELDGKIVGHFLFSHFPLSETKEGGHINDNSIVMLAPVSVHADYFHQHIGISMLKLGIEKVKEHGFKGINVEGDYHFYNRVGFRTSSEYGIYPTSGIPMQEPRCMMCMETSEGSLENIGGYVVYDMYYNA